MSPFAESLFRTALTLPETDRMELSDALSESVGHPPSPNIRGDDYLAELSRRSADSDPSHWIAADEMLRRVHAKLGLP